MLKRIVIFLTISSFLLSCDFFNSKPTEDLGPVHKEYYANGKIKSICQVKERKRNGICKYYNEKGKLTSTSEFYMNKYHGKSISYYKNGKMQAEVMFANNKRHGAAKTFYEDGKIYIEEKYKEGQLDGIKRKYHPNGQLMMENEFKYGKPSANLVEFNKQGEIINETPEIKIKVEDRVGLNNQYILHFSLTSNSQRVKYFFGELEDGKYLPFYIEPIKSKNGKASYTITVHRGTTIMKKLHIIAKRTTSLGNTQIISKSYNLAVSY